MKVSFSLKRYLGLKLVYCKFLESGKRVFVYEDAYGVRWAKNSRWSLFAYQV